MQMNSCPTATASRVIRVNVSFAPNKRSKITIGSCCCGPSLLAKLANSFRDKEIYSDQGMPYHIDWRAIVIRIFKRDL